MNDRDRENYLVNAKNILSYNGKRNYRHNDLPPA